MMYEAGQISEYASKAQKSALKQGLGFKVYSFSRIIDDLPPDREIIDWCCEVTDTEREQQLRFTLASDITLNPETYAHPGIGVTGYTYKLKFGKLADALLAAEIYKKIDGFKRGDFSARKAKLQDIGIEPGFLGINEKAIHAVSVSDHLGRDRHSTAPIPYVFDLPIREVPSIVFPTGKGKADNLVVVSADTAMGEQLDNFLKGFIGPEAFLFGDIGEPLGSV